MTRHVHIHPGMGFGLGVALTALAVTLAMAPDARANCARPVEYEATVQGNTVVVQPVNFAGRGCPDSSGMLRQEVASGGVVQLAAFCQSGDEPNAAYVDECVPPGQYRYGFGTPYACAPSSCWTTYYAEATVTQALPGSCQRSAGNSAPTAASGVPWSSEDTICTYGNGPTADGGGPGPDGGQLTGGGGGGCQVGRTGGANLLVLGIDGLALLLGGLHLRRRARARR